MVAINYSSSKVMAVAKDVLLAPIYLYQGRKVKRDTVRLPEPSGERIGQTRLTHTDTTENLRTLNLMIVGDSAAAGVGSHDQADALTGQLIPVLQQQSTIHTQFDAICWSLQATTGHTSFDVLRRLYLLPKPDAAIDVMIISVGVNDTTANVSASRWQQQLSDIIIIAQRKFGVRHLIFSSLPPMVQMPALPAPLNGFIGAKALRLDEKLQQACEQYESVHYMAADLALITNTPTNRTPTNNAASVNIAELFASDGFHPSPIAYRHWAQQLAVLIADLLTSNSH